jgi:hypothetical protein
MKQLTIRGFDRDLERRLRELARREGLSLNQAALRLLQRGAAQSVPQAATPHRIGDALDDLAGTWTAADAREFETAIQPCAMVDESFWR